MTTDNPLKIEKVIVFIQTSDLSTLISNALAGSNSPPHLLEPGDRWHLPLRVTLRGQPDPGSEAPNSSRSQAVPAITLDPVAHPFLSELDYNPGELQLIKIWHLPTSFNLDKSIKPSHIYSYKQLHAMQPSCLR